MRHRTMYVDMCVCRVDTKVRLRYAGKKNREYAAPNGSCTYAAQSYLTWRRGDGDGLRAAPHFLDCGPSIHHPTYIHTIPLDSPVDIGILSPPGVSDQSHHLSRHERKQNVRRHQGSWRSCELGWWVSTSPAWGKARGGEESSAWAGGRMDGWMDG